MLKKVPISAKNQRPIIWPRIWRSPRRCDSARKRSIDASCWPNVLLKQDAGDAERLLGDRAHLRHRALSERGDLAADLADAVRDVGENRQERRG